MHKKILAKIFEEGATDPTAPASLRHCWYLTQGKMLRFIVKTYHSILFFQVAAQNCRRRKLDLISSLEVEVNRARQHKQQLLAEREELYRLRHEWSEKLRQLEEAVLRGLNKDSEQFSLQLSQDGENIRVAQRHSSRLTKPARA
jgi:hypothetical protein